MVFQTAPVHRLEDKDPSREACWRELHLQLMDKGVFVQLILG